MFPFVFTLTSLVAMVTAYEKERTCGGRVKILRLETPLPSRNFLIRDRCQAKFLTFAKFLRNFNFCKQERRRRLKK